MHNWLKYSVLITALVLYQEATAESFIVKDIEVRGLRRISPGTLFNYLPIKKGDEFDLAQSPEAIRALFKTGFFSDVQLEREGDVLVVKVVERDAIAKITLSGNSDITSENLLQGLKQVGLTEGSTYDRSLIDKVEQELRRQYFALGKYGAKISSEVKKLGNGRVEVAIKIKEGEAARIKQINIVGNQSYTDKQLLKEFKLTTPTLISFFTKSDQYSKQKLGADLETLRSFYLDNGFINFAIDSTQVSITPDKRDVYITINVTEGDRYTLAGVKLAGDFIVPQEQLFPKVTTKRGMMFSRKDVTQTVTNITERLGDEGYAFANVNPVPDIDNANHTVNLTYFIDPGKRVYVRRINFAGNTKTRDEVLRREMRQMEGGWFSSSKINRSKVRLQRLGFFDEVNVENPAVPGSTDQVDLNYTVTERPSGNLQLGVGFSQVQGIIFNAQVTQDNFLGSGNRVKFAFNNSDINRLYAIGFTNPYTTVHGISQGFDLSYRETNAFNANLTRFNSKVGTFGVNFGVPITEFQSFNLGLDYERTEISTNTLSATQVKQFIGSDCATNTDRPPGSGIVDCSNTFNIFRLSTTFAFDSRNRAILPNQGMLHRIRGEISLPGIADYTFYKVDYDGHLYVPLIDDYTLALRVAVGYGDAYGSTKQLPFFENFYGGGPQTVRGYRANTLGPRDDLGRPLGGSFKTIGNAELILPIPFLQDFKSLRVSAFMDAGNIYDGVDRFRLSNLRLSAGLSGIWVSPFGMISVSYAVPFNKQPGDFTQSFQFTFGTSF